jgi:hypothetical protein
MFGNLFGANLNRKDVVEYTIDSKLEILVNQSNKEKLNGSK